MNSPIVAAYCHPLVPPEWIAAHGVRPQWLRLSRASGAATAMRRGVCPYAAAWIEHVASRLSCPPAPGACRMLAIATTTCDQMRYAAALAAREGPADGVFLMHIPRTWQTDTARQMYREELRRLGRFLQRHGATMADAGRLAEVMRQYDDARRLWRSRPAALSARQYAEALARLRGPTEEHPAPPPGVNDSGTLAMAAGTARPSPIRLQPDSASASGASSPGEMSCVGQMCSAGEAAGGVPVGLVGGPWLEEDLVLYDLIEEAGARIAFDGTEAGQRTLPRPFDPRGIAADPFEELAGAYFDALADVLRRPNHALYDWLCRQIAEHKVRGILLHRYVWCDLWHAEVARLEERCGVPVLDLDSAGDDAGTWPRLVTRVEAFLESLISTRGARAAAPAFPAPGP